MYGYLCTVDQGDGRVAVAYAFHTLKFKISTSDAAQKTNLSYEQIQATTFSFSKHKALITLRDEGVIPKINYEEDSDL